VICTEVGTGDLDSILSTLHSKVYAAFRDRLEPAQMNLINVSFQVYQDAMELKKEVHSAEITRRPDLSPVGSNRSSSYAVPGLSTSMAS